MPLILNLSTIFLSILFNHPYHDFEDRVIDSLLVKYVELVSIMCLLVYFLEVSLNVLNTATPKGWTR